MSSCREQNPINELHLKKQAQKPALLALQKNLHVIKPFTLIFGSYFFLFSPNSLFKNIRAYFEPKKWIRQVILVHNRIIYNWNHIMFFIEINVDMLTIVIKDSLFKEKERTMPTQLQSNTICLY